MTAKKSKTMTAPRKATGKAPKARASKAQEKTTSARVELKPGTVATRGKKPGNNPVISESSATKRQRKKVADAMISMKDAQAAIKAAVAEALANERAKTAPKPASMGRPTTYTPELAAELCRRMSLGASLRKVCQADDMPAQCTVFRWLKDEDKQDFREQYAHAREALADSYADEIVEIADEASDDFEVNTGDSGPAVKLKSKAFERSRIMIDARKWAASKIAPKKYGAKLPDLVTPPGEGGDGENVGMAFVMGVLGKIDGQTRSV